MRLTKLPTKQRTRAKLTFCKSLQMLSSRQKVIRTNPLFQIKSPASRLVDQSVAIVAQRLSTKNHTRDARWQFSRATGCLVGRCSELQRAERLAAWGLCKWIFRDELNESGVDFSNSFLSYHAGAVASARPRAAAVYLAIEFLAATATRLSAVSFSPEHKATRSDRGVLLARAFEREKSAKKARKKRAKGKEANSVGLID